MAVETKQIHIVGSIEDGAGQILYVNPTTAPVADSPAAGAAPDPAPGSGVEIVIEDADGAELQRLRPSILRPSDPADSTAGLIDQRIVPIDGMARLKLLYDGKVLDTFEAGKSEPARPEGQPLLGDVPMGAAPGGPAKRQLELEEYSEPEAGVSYTVQVRPQGQELWQTVAVGRPTPDVVIDANQFPGVETATVRVRRSTGFDDAVVAEGDVDLSYEH